MKIIVLASLLAIFSLLSVASASEMRFAVWYGIKNTANDLDDYKIPLESLVP